MRTKVLFLFLILRSALFSQIYVESKDKQQDPWVPYLVERFSDSPDFQYTPTTINKYGSNTNMRVVGTGFFRVEKIADRWYIIDPDGYAYIHKGVACVAPGTSNKQKAAVQRKWGSNEAWSVYATSWLKSNGFNGSGAWSNVGLLRTKPEPVVYSVIVNPMSTYRNMHRGLVGGYTNAGWQGYEYNIIRVFDPAFETYMDNACRPLAQYKNDKFLLGYFVDNELPWVNDALDRHLKHLSTDDHGYIAAKNWLSERKGKDAGLADITQDDRNAFWDFYAGKFFSLAKQYITKYDPNHMFLGSRFNQGKEELVNPYIFETAGKYCDIISINHYREWEPIASRMYNWESWANTPFMITEFYTKGEDSGLPNETGAGWLVKTQEDRGLFYQNFILKLLKSKGCVGWDWFRYQDNDPEDLTTDPSNRDANKGLVDSEYDDYTQAVALCKYTNDRVYSYLEYIANRTATTHEMSLAPTKDTYIRMMSSDNSVYGVDPLLRVKNSNGSTYERTALIEFDFSTLSDDIVNKISEVEFHIGLLGIYPGTKDPGIVNMKVFLVENINFDESDSNTYLLNLYNQRNETFIGSVTIPVDKNSQNKLFHADVTGMLPSIKQKGKITIRLQMDVETETQFEFASRENINTLSQPYLTLKLLGDESNIIAQQINSTKVFVLDKNLIISGLPQTSYIRLYNLSGHLLSSMVSCNSESVSIPINNTWDKIVLVHIVGEKIIKALI